MKKRSTLRTKGKALNHALSSDVDKVSIDNEESINSVQDHISQLSRLQKDDPEFYNYLKSHDKQLLDFEEELKNAPVSEDDQDDNDEESVEVVPKKLKKARMQEDPEEESDNDQPTETRDEISLSSLENLLTQAGLLNASPDNIEYDWTAVKKAVHYFSIVCQGSFDCLAETSDNIDTRKRKIDDVLESLNVDDEDAGNHKLSHLLKSKKAQQAKRKRLEEDGATKPISQPPESRSRQIHVVFDSRQSVELLLSCLMQNIPTIIYHKLSEAQTGLNHKNVIQKLNKIRKSSNLKAVETIFHPISSILMKLLSSVLNYTNSSSMSELANKTDLLNVICHKDDGFLVQMTPLLLLLCSVASRYNVQVNKVKLKKLMKWVICSILSTDNVGQSVDCKSYLSYLLNCSSRLEAMSSNSKNDADDDTGITMKLVKVVFDCYKKQCLVVTSRLLVRETAERDESKKDGNDFGFSLVLNLLSGSDSNSNAQSVSALLLHLSVLSANIANMLTSKFVLSFVARSCFILLKEIDNWMVDISKTVDEKALANKKRDAIGQSLLIALITRFSSMSLIIATRLHSTILAFSKYLSGCNEPNHILSAILCKLLVIVSQQVVACHLNKFVPTCLQCLQALQSIIHLKKISTHETQSHQACFLLLQDTMGLIDSDLIIYHYHPAFPEYAFPIAASLKKNAKQLGYVMKSQSNSNKNKKKKKKNDIEADYDSKRDVNVVRIKGIADKAIDWSNWVRKVRVAPLVMQKGGNEEHLTIEYSSHHGIEPLLIPIELTGSSLPPCPSALQGRTAVERWVAAMKSKLSKGVVKYFLPIMLDGFTVEENVVIAPVSQPVKKRRNNNESSKAKNVVPQAIIEESESEDDGKLIDVEDMLEEFEA